jgi:hypothetical protein
MRFYKAKIILISSFLVVGFLGTPAQAEPMQLVVAADHTTGYNRALFKHWIDADKNGCNTRAEVLIEEAITKPKVGAKCTLTGGKWLSAYDGKSVSKASDLDVDHMVPLAEAWRSGAWKWSSAKRQAYANDLDDARALIAVTLSTNRSKGDKDPALWMPSIDQCTYTQNWISIKFKYALTVDAKEAIKLNSLINSCGFGVSNTPAPAPTPTPIDSATPTVTPTPTVSATPTITPTVSPTPVVTPSAIPTPTPTVSTAPVITPTPTPVESSSSLIVTPGAFCAPAGATGVSKSGVTYTCKTSSTDTRNRWRQ